MKLRTVAAVAGAGLAAVANRGLAAAGGDLEPAVFGEQHTYRWRGMDVAYTELGDSDDRDLVLFHGINAAASGIEYEPVADALAEEYHVIVPDLPGFGRSDRPPLLYSATLYTAFVREFLTDVAEDPIPVASSLTGGYLADALDELEAAPERLVLICPTAETMPGRRLWLRTLLRSPVLGTAIFNGITSRKAIEYFSADHSYYDPSCLTETRLDYQWRSAHQPGARYAPASFVSGYLDPDLDLATTLADTDTDVTLVWGRETELTPLSEGRDLAEAIDARLVVFDYAKLLPHVEHPDEFVETLSADLLRAEQE
jgi:pimeloyl-ACP methyl ester carboxylesterase